MRLQCESALANHPSEVLRECLREATREFLKKLKMPVEKWEGNVANDKSQKPQREEPGSFGAGNHK